MAITKTMHMKASGKGKIYSFGTCHQLYSAAEKTWEFQSDRRY